MLILDDGDFQSGVPLMRVTLSGQMTMEEAEAYFGWMRTERGRIFSIWDCEAAKVSSMEVMRRWAAWMKDDETREKMRSNVVGLVFVIPNAAVRGALRFILALAPMECRMWVVSTVGEAECLAREHLVAEALVTPRLFEGVCQERLQGPQRSVG